MKRDFIYGHYRNELPQYRASMGKLEIECTHTVDQNNQRKQSLRTQYLF
jgi:hypothetical protein